MVINLFHINLESRLLGLDNKQIILNMCLEDCDDFIHENSEKWPRFIDKMIP